VRSYAVAQTGSWFGDWVHSAATDAMGPLAGAARIRTTLQPRTQAIAENVMRTVLDRGAGGAHQAALVAMTPDGAVVAMVGGRAYDDTQFNRAVDAQRQPGSAFSLSVYLAALRLGWKLDDTIPDAPLNRAGSGPELAPVGQSVTLEQAFVRSHNGATLHLAEAVGTENVVRAARDLGIEADLAGDPGLGAGTKEVNLLDLTGAYASVAAGRLPVQPWAILGVSEDATTDPSIARDAPGQGREPEHLDELRRLLSAALVEGTGGEIALAGNAAGKSATSEAFRDGWFIGYTDGLIAGVWVGNDDNTPLDEKTPGRFPQRSGGISWRRPRV
jgi:membrane peptidoglycan carboxypeptidase